MKKNPLVDIGQKLRNAGILPTTYDFRSIMTKWQKENIREKARKYQSLLDSKRNPENYYKSKVGKDTAKILKKSDFEVTPRGYTVIPKKQYDTIKIENKKLIYEKNGEKKVTELVGAKDFHKNLKKLIDKKLKNNQMVTVQIGDKSAFNRRFVSMADLTRYVNNEMVYRGNRKEVQALMSVVTITKYKKQPNAKKSKKPKK